MRHLSLQGQNGLINFQREIRSGPADRPKDGRLSELKTQPTWRGKLHRRRQNNFAIIIASRNNCKRLVITPRSAAPRRVGGLGGRWLVRDGRGGGAVKWK